MRTAQTRFLVIAGVAAGFLLMNWSGTTLPVLTVGSHIVPVPVNAGSTPFLRVVVAGSHILLGGAWLAVLLMDARRYLTSVLWTALRTITLLAHRSRVRWRAD